MGASLDITGLTLRFGGVTALDGLDLSVASGTVLGVAGPNGSGKSSLINVLTGHYQANGKIALDGQPIEHLATSERARLGLVRTFQTPRVYRRMSVIDNMRVAVHATQAIFRGRSDRRHRDGRLRDDLAIFGLSHRADALPDALTPYELRLLELARAHATGATVVLLDEPSAGASEDEAHRLSRILIEHLMPGRTVLLVEHRLDMLRALCADLVVLRAGRKIAFGSPSAVLDSREIRTCLMGEPVDA
ncbi:amino acid/amide ABC transporter ATP-binding protein 1, HAAT family [Roseivivax lentus]|uniref:Amino acid/amide ABC transporter ATP-binding protein 1, HAAT family n=1 Tax=Roseivivax lentus TaxID=633194 RepID=A0A1N7PCI3_9RHOB|nr:ATP-binding cassette domain-containing protein [Roseivivax lentus]SIT08246.1 amino acid/amide ABC transporter ATP-binding protein 1, HAAT family [Roseivivax lentus]